jgi:hypothetical protein
MAFRYEMSAEENYDATRVAAIAGLSTYTSTFMCTDQNYQGIQWDPVRRNLMYMYVQNIPSDPNTNNTAFTLWDGETAIAPTAAIDTVGAWNSSVGVKNIDTGDVTYYLNYDAAETVPNGIGGGDGTWRRYTNDFHAVDPVSCRNGPGMTDPHTGNFWINGESCILYCFRLEDDYAQVISPLRPVIHVDNIVQITGFNDDWAFAQEVDKTPGLTVACPAKLYVTPREFTADEIADDELLIYATYDYPRTSLPRDYRTYNREVFDQSGNFYLATCSATGDKNFELYKFTAPAFDDYGFVEGGGFTEITPWGAATGPNADKTGYTLHRTVDVEFGSIPETPNLIPLALPATNEIAIISKFFPSEYTAASVDPALMKWSCTYVGDLDTTPTFDHHSSFVTGYMTSDWEPTNLAGADYAVVDAFEVNRYLDQSNYEYDIDYSKRWFFFLCTKVVSGVSDEIARIVLVEYSFVNGEAPAVVQVIDEQGWDDAYPDFPDLSVYPNTTYEAYTGGTTSAAVATAMQTRFNYDGLNPTWDSGIYDAETKSFWWSGGGTNKDNFTPHPYFTMFDADFLDRTGSPPGDGETAGATPPFMRLRLSEDGDGDGIVDDDLRIRVWTYSLDGHDYYVLRLGPSETLVYDLTTGTWARWESPGRDNWRAHVGQNWIGMSTDTFTNAWGSDVVAGDDATGVLWILDPSVGRDERSTNSDDAFERVVIGGLALKGREYMPCNAVTLDLAVGVPLTATTIGLRTSDDFGHTWHDHGDVTVTASDFSKVVEWYSMGTMQPPGRLFEITDTGATVRISGLNMR